MLLDLLARTSRTFAPAIQCLSPPTRHEVLVAYLLFRIADTIEDGVHLDRAEKLAALERFAALFQEESDLDSDRIGLDLPRVPSDNAAYLALLKQLPLVISTLSRLDPTVRGMICESLQASLAGMHRFIAAGTPDGGIQIESVSDLREYCYAVAGIVGELLTSIFVRGEQWPEAIRIELNVNARWFGEGLQLVNILKDTEDDRRDGRRFVPCEATRHQLFDLAREDLSKAEAYVSTLKRLKATPGVVAFTSLPLRLAWRTLEYVEAFGPGSKVPRSEVLRLMSEIAPDGPTGSVAHRPNKISAK